MGRPDIEIRDLSELAPYAPPGALNRATQGGTFRIPEKGPGCHSLINALRRKETFEKEPPALSQRERRLWNLNHQK